MEQLVTIELFGQSYTFKTQSDTKLAKEVADYLADEVSRVENLQSGKSPNLNHMTVMILAALNIANEHLQLKHDRTRVIAEISDRSNELIRKLDLCCMTFSGTDSYKLQTRV